MEKTAETAVTGSTGYVGGQVAALLAEAGVAQRLLVRSPSKAPQLKAAEIVPSTYSDGDQVQRALEGVQLLFMVSAAEAEGRLAQHFAFIDGAARAGVRHVVYTSFFGASPRATFTLARDHFATEERLKASGMDYTFLRDNLYLDFLPLMTGDDGVIRGPAGNGTAAAVARIDVARTAAAILRDPGPHRGLTYDLTGPEELSLADAARIITEETGRPTSFVNETLKEAYRSREVFGAPAWQMDAWVSTYTAIAAGELAGVSSAVEDITGRRPLSLRNFLRARGH